jgi:hypothetical protein
MSEHSVLPPSSAARRVACPASRKLEALYPREQTEAAQEGEPAHEECAALLRARIEPGTWVGGEGRGDISDIMYRHCEMYSHYVLGLMGSSRLHIEERLEMPGIHPECWGTPDAWFVENETLHMFDFKYGFGPVEVYENWQMIEYAAGINERYTKAVFHIVQPRASHPDGPIRTWEVELKDLVEYWDMLMRTEWEAMQSNPVTKPSSQCVNCQARHACPALQKTVLNNINTVDISIPHDMNAAELGNELRILHNAAKLLDARITGLEQEALSLLKSGKRVPHYELGEIQSLEKWIKDEKEITALGELFDIELRKPPEVKFITPKQAIKAGIPAKVVRQYSETPKGAKKLQPIDERKIRKMFS